MLVVYDSKTGNVERFVKKLPFEYTKISKGIKIKEFFVLVTYTTGFGQVPESTIEFLKENHLYLQAVASSGNMNWGDSFGKSGEIVATLYNVPLISKFELSGTKKDVEKFIQEVIKFDQ